MWHAHVDVLVVSQEDPSVNMDRWSAGSWSVNSWKRVEVRIGLAVAKCLFNGKLPLGISNRPHGGIGSIFGCEDGSVFG